MESERVDRPDVVDILDRLAVALERIFFILSLLARIKVLDADTAFDRTDGIPCNQDGTSTLDTRGGTLNQPTLPVRHTRQTPRHKLETTFPRLRRLAHLADIINMEQPARHGHHERVVDEVHAVHTLWERMRRHLGRRHARIPEAQRLVPGASDEHIYARGASCERHDGGNKSGTNPLCSRA